MRLRVHFRHHQALMFGCFVFGLLCWSGVVGPQARSVPLLLEAAEPEDKNLRNILNTLEQSQGLIANIQRELVSRPAVGPECGGSGEEQKARWLKAWLHERGIYCERLDYPDDRVESKVRPNLVAVYPKLPPRSGRTLWLLAHLDVAAPGPRDLWHSDPFALRVDGDAMYGRGTEDNNQAITVSLLLLDAMQNNAITPPMRLGLIFTSAALTDYRVGIKHVLAKKPELFGPGDLVLVTDFGDAAGSLIGVGEKGNIWLKVTVTGKGGHASTPGLAVNAFASAATLVHELRFLHKEFPAEDPLFTPPYTTITPTMAEGSSSVANHIPAAFTFYLDARVMRDYSYDALQAAVRRLADKVEQQDGVQITIEQVESTAPAHITPADAEVLQSLIRAVRSQLGIEPRLVGTSSVTMAASLREQDIPVAVWAIQNNFRNSIDEYSLISAHIKQAQVIARILFDRHIGVLSGKTGATGPNPRE